MKYCISIIFLFTSFLSLAAQETYWVTFTDKDASMYSIEEPEEFLSAPALARRAKFNISIVENDLPVPSIYTEVLSNLDAQVLHKSKWMNGVVMKSSPAVAIEIADLSFVKEVKLLTTTSQKTTYSKFDYTETLVSSSMASASDFGAAGNQIKMIEGDLLHDLGFSGDSIEIAVFDNGFPNIDSSAYFANARAEDRLIPVYDFVQNDSTVDDGGSHGLNVLATMLADVEGSFVGTAPGATYYLFKTEDVASEGLHEEINWMLAAEKADSMMGANAIFTTSLGYSNEFDNPADEHIYDDMDGNTTIITNAADIAASKGILVINSAGNEGNNPWFYITAPADGDSVLAVGAVNPDAGILDFSSRGPSFDNRLKPNVCTQGGGCISINAFDQIITINGTSFSCPILAGYAACLWQTMKDTSNMDVFRIIEESAHLFATPDNDFGYGVPNLRSDWVSILERIASDVANRITIYPNPVVDNTVFEFTASRQGEYDFAIYNMMGQKMNTVHTWLGQEEMHQFVLSDWSLSLSSGTYVFVVAQGDDKVFETFVVE